MSIDKITMERMFPAPREVDRYLYDGNADFEYFPSMFPATPEVDRGIYDLDTSVLQIQSVSGPSRG